MWTFFIAAFWMWLVLIAGFVVAKLWAMAFARASGDGGAISRKGPNVMPTQRRIIDAPAGSDYLEDRSDNLMEG
jgi:hypothetical protein